MKKLIRSFKALGLTLLTSLVLIACSQLSELHQDTKHGGNLLPKTWSGKQVLSVRYELKEGGYRFVKSGDSVRTEIEIKPDGRVVGTIGMATLIDSKVIKNRTSLGRMLNLATDYAIEGKLKGFTFEGDTIPVKEITIPLWLKDGYLYGDIFMNKGLSIYPMGGMVLY
jgi:hypothetical protein